MKVYLQFFLVLLILSCQNKKTIKETYYDTGELHSVVSLDKNNLRDGLTLVYYKNGNLKDKATYRKDKIIDTVFAYYQDGALENIEYQHMDSIYSVFYDSDGQVIKEGVFCKANSKNGWIKTYDIKNDLKYKYILKNIYGKENHTNTMITYGSKGDTIKEKSYYFKIVVPDSVVVGKYDIGTIYFNSDKSGENDMSNKSLVIIVGENIKEDYSNLNEIKVDSFYTNSNKFAFKFSKTGDNILRGKFIEKLMITSENKENKEKLDVIFSDRDFYFEVPIYVKDSIINGVN
ncbi:MAG: hypothetical protein COW66_08650 [Flavobacteriaceae bacterium CG18_big_fil_WC_8_21_14_2_50_34_36]|nr:MAG: hypothetical protein COW66_08650 [Flavobacteriaceae bacterium CG18_big_fil_WC_8_21_14_2_50_34_36]PIV50883.1 MAG: hypothetical protein COS19_03095 [Flavobacteriaceae bacterium CG02_land_8_20_14_3_00_34_13]PIZ09009.1 MAG: hypothetical protein COY56_01000 [Flavobacteriaceae bacterium CG_4_10_14_0_8_um_filter_34_31]PJC06296.1 MAG: hypothetical protein CO068_11935 [Flavobacteriaceae bacterium CG_4_9_14_0_8_um_filter_34_30]